jgi:long-chain fatty acid transport protein
VAWASLFALATAASLEAAGFALFEQGARPMGTGMAFTGRADDPSTLYYNPGGLAFFERRARAAGLTLVGSEGADFEGADPFPGAGVEERQEALLEALPHGFWVEPIRRDWNLGFAVTSPFGLSTEWRDAGRFSGRAISSRAELRALDVGPSLGWRPTPRLGVGVGLVFRFSEVELERYLTIASPRSGAILNFGRLELDSGYDRGLGWSAGLLHRVDEGLSWGLAYRSEVTVEYVGDARLTQISTGEPALDQLLRFNFPFDRDLDVESEIDFPAQASVGVSWASSPATRLMVDLNWTSWSSFDRVPIGFGAGGLAPVTLEQAWDDTMTYRAGLAWTRPRGDEWRFGLVFDESPQPDERVGPLLADADRRGLTLGWGRTLRERSIDLALMVVDFAERTTRVNADGFDGTYRTTAWLLGATYGF